MTAVTVATLGTDLPSSAARILASGLSTEEIAAEQSFQVVFPAVTILINNVKTRTFIAQRAWASNLGGRKNRRMSLLVPVAEVVRSESRSIVIHSFHVAVFASTHSEALACRPLQF